MKKLLIGLITAGSLAATMALTACSPSDSSGIGKKFDELNTTSSIYAFSAASAGMIISSETQNAPENPQEPVPTPLDDQAAPPADGASDEFAELDKYMSLVDSLLSDGGFDITEQASDREEYEHMTIFTYRDIEGKDHTYRMHYNLTRVAHYDDDFDDDDRDDDEEEYSIDGVMVIEGVDYDIRGVREIENERNESESETKFYVTLGEGDYMLVEQSYESEGNETEQEYSYSVYRDGQCVERSSFEYESEDDETEVKMTANKDGNNQALYFTRETVRGREIIILRTGTGKDAQSYYVTPVTDADGNVTYEYELIQR